MGRRHLARACVARPTPRLTGTFRVTWAQTAPGRSFEKARGCPGGSVGEGPPAEAGGVGLIPWLGRSRRVPQSS